MIALSTHQRYFLYKGFTDMRKSFDGLCGLVRNELDKDPASGCVFIFFNKPRTHVKILFWERDSYNFKKYRTPACKECPVKHLSTGRAQGGRELDRSEFADAVEENNKRYHENTSLYRKRQELERSGTHEDK
jgi:transposase